MRGAYDEYKQDKWRIRIYWKGQRLQVYRNKRGEILEGRGQTQKAWIQLNQEIEDKLFDPSEWTKEKPFLLKNAFQIYQKTKQCGEDSRYNRARFYRNHIGSELGEMDIREITTVHVNQLHGALITKKLSDKTILEILKILHAVLSFNRVGDKIRWPKIEIQPSPIKWLTEEQQEIAMGFLSEKDKPIYRFLQITGCRPSEACALSREDVDWDNGFVCVRRSMGRQRRITSHTKTRRLKLIPIAVFEGYEEILKPKEVTPFIFSWRGRPYDQHRLWRFWRRAIRAANKTFGIPIIPVRNAFRHSMASQLINAGVPIEAISKMLGHASIRITETVYANILPETAWGYRKVTKIDTTNKHEKVGEE